MTMPASQVTVTYELPLEEKIEILKNNIASQARKAYSEEITYDMQEAAGATDDQLSIPIRRRDNFLIGQKACEDKLADAEALLAAQEVVEEPVTPSE